MNSFLNTPLQVPLSPFISFNLNFPSPFVSPYAAPQNHYYTETHNEDQLNDFENFQLNEPQQNFVKDIAITVNTHSIIQPEIYEEKVIQNQSSGQSIQSLQECEMSQKIKRVINLLVKHGDKPDEKLRFQKTKSIGDNKQLGQVFDILAKKFKKLKKTKEQMTKYCMRKAFKFLADKHKNTIDCKDNGNFLKQYFEHMQSQAFYVPFKKNSEDKTMNTNFLKKVFSSYSFTTDYQQFMKKFVKLVDDDNNKKIKYLAQTIKDYMNTGTLKKLQTVKRLPWTQVILDKTIDLTNKLIMHSPYYQTGDQLDQNIQKKTRKHENNESRHSIRRKSTTSLAQTISSPINTSNRVNKI